MTPEKKRRGRPLKERPPEQALTEILAELRHMTTLLESPSCSRCGARFKHVGALPNRPLLCPRCDR